MLRINRFNIGKDPISTWMIGFTNYFGIFEKDKPHEIVTELTSKATENIQGLERNS